MRGSTRSILVLTLAGGPLAAGAAPLAAQEAEAPLQRVELTVGGVLYGRITGSGDPVRLVVADGDTIDLPASAIRQVEEADGTIVGSEFIGRDPNETRLFFGPTGRTLNAGEGYLGVFEFSLPFLAYGVTDRITIAAGTPLVFAIGMTPILYVAPKVQLVRAGGLTGSIGSLSFLGEFGSAGVVYAVATADMDNGMSSLTGGAGWGYASGEVTDRPVVMLGGDVRVSRSVKLLTENYFVPGEDFGLLAGGIRFIGEHISADVGLAFMNGTGVALPIVNFVVGL